MLNCVFGGSMAEKRSKPMFRLRFFGTDLGVGKWQFVLATLATAVASCVVILGFDIHALHAGIRAAKERYQQWPNT